MHNFSLQNVSFKQMSISYEQFRFRFVYDDIIFLSMRWKDRGDEKNLPPKEKRERKAQLSDMFNFELHIAFIEHSFSENRLLFLALSLFVHF